MTNTTTVAAAQLLSFIERIERLTAEQDAIADDKKEVFAEAKSSGFDTKALREIIRIRKQDKDEREEAEGILELYKSALGMV